MDESASRVESTRGTVTDQRIGSYRIVQPLGTGGMSSVYRAVHIETGHEVALKVLTRTLAKNSTLLQRFLREARSAETLEHANIVSIYDRGIDQGRHYLVLEYVEGGDFHEFVQRRGPLGVADAILVVKDVARALKYAAGRGLIHRDIKPSNILRTPTGQIKLIDLGLALQAENEDERVTREGTTVGTVDYMAPEQARDSRATSIQSDMYSLGCTFYFLLTGVPPFPGGDITEKLTRHAKATVPDIRDLRQDVTPQVASIMQRMMAKRPEDRFISYDDLIAALDNAPIDRSQDGQGIALIPLDDAPEQAPPAAHDATPANEERDESVSDRSDDEPYGVISLAELASDLDEGIHPNPSARQPSMEPIAPLLRRGSPEQNDDEDADSAEPDETQAAVPSRSPSSVTVWILPSAIIGIACILLGIGLIQFLGVTGTQKEDALSADSDASVDLNRGIVPAPRSNLTGAATVSLSNSASRNLTPKKSSDVEPKAQWVEEQDSEASPIDTAGSLLESEARSKLLPEWARAPVPDRISGPLVVVRRVADATDPTIFPTLHSALDGNIGGTVELADEGPLFINDFSLPGKSRLIRARPGYRPIVRIEQPKLVAVTEQSAVFPLKDKNLTLDGIDLIVNVRDLPSSLTALFSCAGANLTLKNCSITILDNPISSSFAFVRVTSSAAQSNPSRILLEKTLVRGGFASGLDLASGSTELVLHDSVILGGPGPLIRIAESDPAPERRIFLVESILAGPGPIIERATLASTGRIKPLIIRAFGSAFGRFHGAGISSVISSTSSSSGAAQQIDWRGDHNLFAGWKGFFACGNEPTVTVADLAAVRSTWSATDPGSREVLSPWPPPSEPASASPGELLPFVPNQVAILRRVAQPRKGLFEKTVDEYPSPMIPVPVGWALDRVVPQGGGGRFSPRLAGDQISTRFQVPKSRTNPASRDPAQVGGVMELTFNTGAPPWNGDLGAFLRERVIPGTRHARVRVTGSGPHHFTPVQLPRGVWLEVRVDPLAEAEPPSWLPQPQSTGTALIELQGGALVLSNVVLQHEESARLDHLIHVEDGHLVVSHCRLITRMAAGGFAGDLIGFRAMTTEPKSSDLSPLLFRGVVDRPVCRLIDSTLITDGTALKAELGRGLVAIEQCAVSAGTAAVELIPAKVARRRFEVDLWLEHCTLTAERNLIRLGPWPGLPPGPDRPWLITSRNCVFVAMSDQRPRETVLLRADADALARGTVFWQASDDVVDVDFFTAAGEGAPSNNSRTRELQHQWIDFWGSNHIRHVSGPRGTGAGLRVRFRDKLRPGRIEPVDLILFPEYHSGRDLLTVGADLIRQGMNAPAARNAPGQNPQPKQPGRPSATGGAVPF
jgi:eukaryotic-like serine/threonine-protein kinase